MFLIDSETATFELRSGLQSRATALFGRNLEGSFEGLAALSGATTALRSIHHAPVNPHTNPPKSPVNLHLYEQILYNFEAETGALYPASKQKVCA